MEYGVGFQFQTDVVRTADDMMLHKPIFIDTRLCNKRQRQYICVTKNLVLTKEEEDTRLTA